MDYTKKIAKTEQITVRVSAEELKLINDTADFINGSKSDVIRVALILLESEQKKWIEVLYERIYSNPLLFNHWGKNEHYTGLYSKYRIFS